MKIDISVDEYRALLDVLHMADWVMHAHENEPNPDTAPYDAVIQKFYSMAKTMGQDNLIEYDSDVKKYFSTREHDDESASWDFIDEFTNDTFWDELVHRLTDRDVAHLVNGYDQLEKLSMEERFMREAPIIERYVNEFDDHGLDRLRIVEHFETDNAAPARTSD